MLGFIVSLFRGAIGRIFCTDRIAIGCVSVDVRILFGGLRRDTASSRFCTLARRFCLPRGFCFSTNQG
jgi:hypothetical protein